MSKCWECKYFEYDEIYITETEEEIQIANCLMGNDVDECEKCKDFTKEQEKKMNRVNYCKYCKHADVEIDEEPCISCSLEIGNFELQSKYGNLSLAGSIVGQCVFKGREYDCGSEGSCEICKYAYDTGKADANKDIEPMIREIHDLVYNEAYNKGIETYAKAYKHSEEIGCDKCEHLNDEVKCWQCIEEKLKRR